MNDISMRMASATLLAVCASAGAADNLLVFDRVRISDVTYEAVAAGDVNRDGKLDLITGEYWFEGPSFTTRHRITTIPRVGDYYDDFSDFPMDVDGDGYLDIITGGWWNESIIWRQNPRNNGRWHNHTADKCGNVETIRFWDVDGDGRVEICPNAGGNVVAYRVEHDAAGKPTGKLLKHVIKQGGCGHGLGFGDINGDGRGDFIIPDGWLEAPEKPWEQPWKYHAEFKLGMVSVPILVYDVNGDGKADLIAGQGHDYGLAWYEQGGDGENRTWTKHDIDLDRSQYHEMALADLDNDGKPELITGKRWRAHMGQDPGAGDPLHLSYYRIDGGKFTRFTIDYGPATRASGTGIYLWVADLDGNGWLDIAAPGKEGLYIFYNRGPLNALSQAAAR